MQRDQILPNLRRFILVGLGLLGASTIAIAENIIVVDEATGKVLIAQNAEEKRPVASLTKVATAMVVLDWAKVAQVDLGTLAVVPVEAARLGGPNPRDLRPGDQISLRDALYASLISSDNLAALTLSDHVGRALLASRNAKNVPEKAFVYEMNQLAASLGMKKTSFVNAHGLETSTKGGYSTASDMSRLAIYAMRNPGLALYVSQKSRVIHVIREGQKRTITLRNTNEILGKDGVDGLKTGMTRAAGPCLIASAAKKPIVKKLDDGRSEIWNRRLISVLLNSSDRFKRSEELLKEAWQRRESWMQSGGLIQNPATEQIVLPR